MQVMQGSDFEQTEVLVGGANETEGFGVSDDPMLMSMLSTGLYQRPLRTMIQEIMFNAWDAHRMADIQGTTPIKITLSERGGLQVQDFGPGIPEPELHGIYCIYGNSTKRNNDNQTGGFGLGSKSPYAYTESFTVTNCNAGSMNMYLMSRVNEDNGGKPGKTKIMGPMPTEVQGITVVVPLKNDRDIQRTWEYIESLVRLSGIWADVSWLENDGTIRYQQEYKTQTLAPGDYSTEDVSRGIWAIYGGVHYEIPKDDGYAEEWEELALMRNLFRSVAIGFAPNELTPLPNREALNLSEKSILNIKKRLEQVAKTFQQVLEPMVDFSIEWCVSEIMKRQAPIESVLYLGHKLIESSQNFPQIVRGEYENLDEFLIAKMPLDAPFEFWKNLANTAAHRSNTFKKATSGLWHEKVQAALRAANPEHAEMFDQYDLRREPTAQLCKINDSENLDAIWEGQKLIREAMPTKAMKDKVSFRLAGRYRTEHELVKFKIRLGDDKDKTPYEDRTTLTNKQGNAFHLDGWNLPKVCILAKTITALNEGEYDDHLNNLFMPNQQGKTSNLDWEVKSKHRTEVRTYSPVLEPGCVAFVVNQAKDGYDLAKAALEKAGWHVIEGPEPVKITRAASKGPRPKPLYHLLAPHNHLLEGEGVEDPKDYLVLTMRERSEGNSSYHRPSYDLLKVIADRWPKTAILESAGRIGPLQKRGLSCISNKVKTAREKLLKDKERMKHIALYELALSDTELNEHLLANVEIQKLLGLPYLRTAQRKTFMRDVSFLRCLKRENWNQIGYSQGREIENELGQLTHDLSVRPIRDRIREVGRFTRIFHESALSARLQGMTPHERKSFTERLVRFLKTSI